MKSAFFLIFFSYIIPFNLLMAKVCPTDFGKYGDGLRYQDISCRVMVSSDRKDSSTFRSVTFNDDGLIQVFSSFPGTTNSNSTAARVFYLFPKRNDRTRFSAGEDNLTLTHPSGAVFKFNKYGKMSSKDLSVRVSPEINAKNNSGVELSQFSSGIIIDIGYKMGGSPTLSKNSLVTVSDKNSKKCSLKNTDIHTFKGAEVELTYKTNQSLYNYLSKKCPELDLSDLLTSSTDLKGLATSRSLGDAPRRINTNQVDDSARSAKPQIDSLDSLIDSLDKRTNSGPVAK